MADTNDHEAVRHEVLADNTAQDILKDLTKLVNGEKRFRNRWIWELMQNARDAAPAGGVTIEIQRTSETMIFRHNGMPFTRKGITHLIYHGSTKQGQDDAVGQYGTGFIATHLISRHITVKGCLDTGEHFTFPLDRSGDSANDLKSAMDKSWEGYVASLASPGGPGAGEFTTEFVYPLSDHACQVVDSGIQDLRANAGFVLAFNDRIAAVIIEADGRKIFAKKVATVAVTENLNRVTISFSNTQKPIDSASIAVLRDGDVCVATELRERDSKWTTGTDRPTPRIFVAFPLTGTEDFCLPVVVNSVKFDPREERDSLNLNGTSAANKQNMALMEAACTLVPRLAELAGTQGWLGVASLARIPEFKEREWLDQAWIKDAVDKNIIATIRATKMLSTKAGTLLAPKDARIPVATSGIESKEIWELATKWNTLAEKLPIEEEVSAWEANVVSWMRFTGRATAAFPESLELLTLCSMAANSSNLSKLKESLTEGADSLRWINNLHSLLARAGQMKAFDEMRILPDQNGIFRTRRELRRDDDVDEVLKGIAEELGVAVRSVLLDGRIKLPELLKLLDSKNTEQVLGEALQKLKEYAKNEPNSDRFRAGSISLFSWLISQKLTDNLDGFPVLASTEDQEVAALCFLKRLPTTDEKMPLMPVAQWPDIVRTHRDLFPKHSIINDAYAITVDDWKLLADQGYVRHSPLFISRQHLETFVPDEPLPEKDDKGKKLRHRTNEPVDISALAFFGDDSTGLDAVRSKVRAANLLRFLVGWVLLQDASTFDELEVACECGGTHRYYRASWLIPLSNRKWVSIGDGKREVASAESISQLVREYPDLRELLTDGWGAKLLEALKISIADLMLRSVAEKESDRIAYIGTMSEIVRVSGNDPEKARQIVAELSRSKELVEEILEHKQRREKVQRNKDFGAAIEIMLSEALKNSGLKVERTGVGSDFKVTAPDVEEENDVLEDGREVLFKITGDLNSFLIEVKATTVASARMTVTQARTAVGQPDRFILCMILVDGPDSTIDSIRHNSRFIADIGVRLEPAWREYSKIESAKRSGTRPFEGIELVMTENQTRFAVDKSVWLTGLTFAEAIGLFLRK